MQIWGEVRMQHGHATPPAAMEQDAGLDGVEVAEVAHYWAQEGMAGLHATDVDAALGQGRNWTSVPYATRSGVPVRFGGGIRHMAEVEQVLTLGVQQVVVGTQAIDHPLWLRELAIIFPRRILAALDLHQGNLLVDGRRRIAASAWTAWLDEAAAAGIEGIVYTELDEGRAGAPDVRTVGRIAQHLPVTVTAGHATPESLDALRDAGAAAAIVPAEAPAEAWRETGSG